MWLAGAALAISSPAAADTEHVQSEAIMVRALSFNNLQGLHFGGILPSPAAGNVTVSPTGTRTSAGGVTLVGSSHEEARFAGMGVFNETVRIRIQSSTTLTRVGGGGAAMSMQDFTIGSTPVVTLTNAYQDFVLGSPTGMYNFGVGARLNVNANQLPGTYRGTFVVQLIYQ